jgi:hypothetical protein
VGCVDVCLIVCDLEISTMKRPVPGFGCSAIERKKGRNVYKIFTLLIAVIIRVSPYWHIILQYGVYLVVNFFCSFFNIW